MKKFRMFAVLAVLTLSAVVPQKSDALPVPTNGPGVTGCHIEIHGVAFAGTVLAYPVIVCQ